MKQNFTTPEQSLILLELGLPEKSADCFYNRYTGCTEIVNLYDNSWAQTDRAFAWCEGFVPIWSAGQLLYILKECIERDDDKEVIFMDLAYKQGSIIDLLMDIFKDRPVMDFSKLED